jgi:hypothetical protein
VLLADRPGLPTRKVLFEDPTASDVLFEVWTTCGRAGFVGLFNCRHTVQPEPAVTLSGSAGPDDVPGMAGQRFACFAHCEGSLSVLDRSERQGVSLHQGEFELLTLVPIERGFAPIGLADKFNSHAGLEKCEWQSDTRVALRLRDGGAFLAYSQAEPKSAKVDGQQLTWEYDRDDGRLHVELPGQGPRTLQLDF